MQVDVNANAVRQQFKLFLRLAILCAACIAFGQQRDPPPEIPVQQWLQGNDRQDVPWRVQLGQPWLTFQQRWHVQTKINFRVREALKAGVSLRDLHFIVKVAGEDGRWLPGQSYAHFEPAPGIADADEIDSVSNFYVQPGAYKIAVIAFDSATRRGNLWRGNLRVSPIKNDPLPAVDRNLPTAEFLPPAPPLRLTGLNSMLAFDPWAFGKGELLLPVAKRRPVQVDVVVNLSLSAVTDWDGSEGPNWQYQLNAAKLLRIGNVLSQLHLNEGCLRFSAIDIRRQKIFVDRVDARSLNWPQIGDNIRSLNRQLIEVTTLAGERRQPDFLARYMEQVSSGRSPCQVASQPESHILIVVSDAFVFPAHTKMTTVQAERIPNSVCYYLRVVPVAGARWDEIGRVLKPLRPVSFDLPDAKHFRKTLAQVIANIERASTGSPHPAR